MQLFAPSRIPLLSTFFSLFAFAGTDDVSAEKHALSSDVLLESAVTLKKSGAKLTSLTLTEGSEFYQQGDNLYFFKVDAQGSWTEDRFFMVSSRVYYSGIEDAHAIAAGSFSVTPLYVTKTLTPPTAKVNVTQRLSVLQATYENDPGVAMKNSIQANLFAISENVTVPIAGSLSAFLALEAQIISGRWVQFPEDGGNFVGYAPLSGTAELGFVYSPNQSVTVRLTAAGISGDVSYGKTYGSKTGVSPNRYIDYAIYSDLSVSLVNWGLTAFVQAGKVIRVSKPLVDGAGDYEYLDVGFSVSNQTLKRLKSAIRR